LLVDAKILRFHPLKNFSMEFHGKNFAFLPLPTELSYAQSQVLICVNVCVVHNFLTFKYQRWAACLILKIENQNKAFIQSHQEFFAL